MKLKAAAFGQLLLVVIGGLFSLIGMTFIAAWDAACEIWRADIVPAWRMVMRR